VFPSNAYETLGKSILESYAWDGRLWRPTWAPAGDGGAGSYTAYFYPAGDLEKLAEGDRMPFQTIPN